MNLARGAYMIAALAILVLLSSHPIASLPPPGPPGLVRPFVIASFDAPDQQGPGCYIDVPGASVTITTLAPGLIVAEAFFSPGGGHISNNQWYAGFQLLTLENGTGEAVGPPVGIGSDKAGPLSYPAAMRGTWTAPAPGTYSFHLALCSTDIGVRVSPGGGTISAELIGA